MDSCLLVKLLRICPLNKLTFENKKDIDEYALFTVHNNV